MEGTFEDARGRALWQIGYYLGEIIRYVEKDNPSIDGTFGRIDRLYDAIEDAHSFGLISMDEAEEYKEVRLTIMDEACDALRKNILNRRNDERL